MSNCLQQWMDVFSIEQKLSGFFSYKAVSSESCNHKVEWFRRKRRLCVWLVNWDDVTRWGRDWDRDVRLPQFRLLLMRPQPWMRPSRSLPPNRIFCGKLCTFHWIQCDTDFKYVQRNLAFYLLLSWAACSNILSLDYSWPVDGTAIGHILAFINSLQLILLSFDKQPCR